MVLLGLALAGCKDRPSGPPVGQVKQAHRLAPTTTKNLRDGHQVLRALVKEAARAEVDSNGLFINLGTPDQHKYMLGGWGQEWGQTGSEAEVDYTQLKNGARLFLQEYMGEVAAVVLRMRCDSPGVQLKLQFDDGAPMAGQSLPEEWRVVEFLLPSSPPPGPWTLRFILDGDQADKAEVLVDWVWLRRRGETPPHPLKVQVMNLGEPRRSLMAAPPRIYRYFLDIPERASFVFDYGADRETRFEVSVRSDGKAPASVWKGVSSDGRWQQARVDLSAYAGQIVALELATSGAVTGPCQAAWGEPDLVRPGVRPEPVPIPQASRPRHIIHIVEDATRRDVFKVFDAKARMATPGLDEVAASGVVFLGAYSNSSWTLPSVSSFLTSRYPSAYAMTDSIESDKLLKLPEDAPLLPDHLRRQGYTTAAIVVNPFLTKSFGLERGWDHFENLYIQSAPSHAEKAFERALNWLKKRDQKKPFYLYIHTLDPHDPYEYKDGYTEKSFGGPYKGPIGKLVDSSLVKKEQEGKVKLSSEDRRYVRALYEGEVAFHDHFLKEFLARIKPEPWWDQTLLVYHSDHGEEMWDHGGLDHGHSLYEELVRVPLILHNPIALPRPSRIQGLVELVDLVPTVLDILGLAALPDSQGISLLPTIQGAPQNEMAYALMEGPDRAVRVGAYKLIWKNSAPHLFALGTDPGEKNNIGASHPIARRGCEVYLGEGLAAHAKRRRLTSMTPGPRFKEEKAVIDPKLREQLEALGYVQ